MKTCAVIALVSSALTLGQASTGSPEETLTGRLHTEIVDFANGKAELRRFLVQDDGKMILLDANDALLRDIPANAEVEGTFNRGVFQISKVKNILTTWTDAQPTLGEQRTLVVLIKYIGNTEEQDTPNGVYDDIFNISNPHSMNHYFDKFSYGEMYLSGDVYGWYDVPFQPNEICSATEAAINLFPLVDEDIDFRNYDRVIIMPNHYDCGFSGVSQLSPYTFDTEEGEVDLTVSYFRYGPIGFPTNLGVHELGHNLGLWHANDWECGSSSYQGDCHSVEYGDFFNSMGYVITTNQYNAINKIKLKWLRDQDYGIIGVGESGIFRVYSIENNAGLRALKIETDSFSYYVDYKTDTNFGSFPEVEMDGVLIYTDRFFAYGDSQLLDMTPYENANNPEQFYDSIDSILREGEVFLDVVLGVRIEVVNVTENYVDVLVE